ncbi:MAG: ROK family protein [Bacteroidota bacterium]
MEVLGIDIGGTGIKGAPVNIESGEMLAERYRIPTPSPATPEAVAGVVEAIRSHFDWKGPIGCGFPAAIKNETVVTAANIDNTWIGVNAGELIGRITGCPTHLINDVDAAGYAEYHFGAGKDRMGTVMVIAAGTGIGTALFTDGVLLPNTELGHIYMPNGEEGEKYSANSVRKNEGLSWKEWGNRFGEYLRYLEDLFWPDLMILGGGVSKKSHEYEQYLKVKTELVPAEMLNNAGIVGAAFSAKAIL